MAWERKGKAARLAERARLWNLYAAAEVVYAQSPADGSEVRVFAQDGRWYVVAFLRSAGTPALHVAYRTAEAAIWKAENVVATCCTAKLEREQRSEKEAEKDRTRNPARSFNPGTKDRLEEVLPPAFVDGALVRLVSDGERDWVQIWNMGTKAWQDDTTTSVAEVSKGPTAGPRTLALFGYVPEEQTDDADTPDQEEN
jgi:hypothetical protein